MDKIFLIFTFFFVFAFNSQAEDLNTVNFDTYIEQETNALENILSFLNSLDTANSTYTQNDLNKYLVDNGIKNSYNNTLSINSIKILTSKSFAEISIKPLLSNINSDFLNQVVFSPLSKYKIRQMSTNEYFVYIPFSANSSEDLKISTNETKLTNIEQDVANNNGLNSLLNILDASCPIGFTQIADSKYCEETFTKTPFNETLIEDKKCPEFMYFNISLNKCVPSISKTKIDGNVLSYCPEGFVFDINTKTCYNSVSGLIQSDVSSLFTNPTCQTLGYDFNLDSRMCEMQEIEDQYKPIGKIIEKEYAASYKLKDGDVWEDPEDIAKNPDDSQYNLCKEGYNLEGFDCVQSSFTCPEGATLMDDLYCLTPVTKLKCNEGQILNGNKCDTFIYTKQCLENDIRLSDETCQKTVEELYCDNNGEEFTQTATPTQKKDEYIEPIIYNPDFFDKETGIISISGGNGGLNSLNGSFGDLPLGLTYDILISEYSSGFKLATTSNENVYGLNITFDNLQAGASCEEAGFGCPADHPFLFTWNGFNQEKSVCPEGYQWVKEKGLCLLPVTCPTFFKKVDGDCVPDFKLPNDYTKVLINGEELWKKNDLVEWLCPEGYTDNGENCIQTTYVNKITETYQQCPSGYEELPDGTCGMEVVEQKLNPCDTGWTTDYNNLTCSRTNPDYSTCQSSSSLPVFNKQTNTTCSLNAAYNMNEDNDSWVEAYIIRNGNKIYATPTTSFPVSSKTYSVSGYNNCWTLSTGSKTCGSNLGIKQVGVLATNDNNTYDYYFTMYSDYGYSKIYKMTLQTGDIFVGRKGWWQRNYRKVKIDLDKGIAIESGCIDTDSSATSNFFPTKRLEDVGKCGTTPSQTETTSFTTADMCNEGYTYSSVEDLCKKMVIKPKDTLTRQVCPTGYLDNGPAYTTCYQDTFEPKYKKVTTYEPVEPFYQDSELICPEGYELQSDNRCKINIYIDRVEEDIFRDSGVTTNKWVETYELSDGALLTSLHWDGNLIGGWETTNITSINDISSTVDTYDHPDGWTYKRVCTNEDELNLLCEDGFEKIDNSTCLKTEYMDKAEQLDNLTGNNAGLTLYCLDGWVDNGDNCKRETYAEPITIECHTQRTRTDTILVCPKEEGVNWIEDTVDTTKCYKEFFLDRQSPIGFTCNEGLVYNPETFICESTTLKVEPTITVWDMNNPSDLNGSQELRCGVKKDYVTNPDRGSTIIDLYTLKGPSLDLTGTLTVSLQSVSSYLYDITLGTDVDWRYNKVLSHEDWVKVNEAISNVDLLNSTIVWNNGEVGKITRVSVDNLTPRIYHEACEGQVWTCEEGMVLEGNYCVPANKVIEKPTCNNSNLFFTESGSCTSKDIVQCPDGYTFNEGICESKFIRNNGFVEEGQCKVTKSVSFCRDGLDEEGENCKSSKSAIDWLNYTNNLDKPEFVFNSIIAGDKNFLIALGMYSTNLSSRYQKVLAENADPEIYSALYYNTVGLELDSEVVSILDSKKDTLVSPISTPKPYATYDFVITPELIDVDGFFDADKRIIKVDYDVPTILTILKDQSIEYTAYDIKDALKDISDSYSIKEQDATTIQIDESEKPVHTCPVNYKLVEIVPDKEIKTPIYTDGELTGYKITWEAGEYNCELDVEYKCLGDNDLLNEETKKCTSSIETFNCMEGYNLKNGLCITGDLLFSNSFVCAADWFESNSYCLSKSDKVCQEDWNVFIDTTTGNPLEKCQKDEITCINGWTMNGTECKKTYDTCKLESDNSITCPIGYIREDDKCIKREYKAIEIDGKCDLKNGFEDNPMAFLDERKCIKIDIACSGLKPEGGCNDLNTTIKTTSTDSSNACVATSIDIQLPKVTDKFVNTIDIAPIIQEQLAQPAQYETLEDRCNTANGHPFSYNPNNPNGIECEYRHVQYDATVDHYSCLEGEGLLFGENLDKCKIVRESEPQCLPGYTFAPSIHQCVKDNLSITATPVELTRDLNCGGDLYNDNGDIWQITPQLFTRQGVKPTLNIMVNHQYNNQLNLPPDNSITSLVNAYLDKKTGHLVAYLNHNTCSNKPFYETNFEVIQVSTNFCPIVQGSRGKMVQLVYNPSKLKCDYVDIVPAIYQKVCRSIDEIKTIPYTIPTDLEQSWITKQPMYSAYENIQKINEDTCSYEITYYDSPKLCTTMDICSLDKPHQTNCMPKTAKPVDSSFVTINPANNGQCIHKWKTCGNDLALPIGNSDPNSGVDINWSFKDDNTCSINFIQRPQYDYCDNNYKYFEDGLTSIVKTEVSSGTNKPNEINTSLEGIFEYIKPEELKIYRTKIVNYKWNNPGTLVDSVVETQTVHTKDRTINTTGLGDINNKHYYGGWTDLQKCDSFRSKYECDVDNGYKLIGQGCDSSNTFDGYTARVDLGLISEEYTTTSCRCTKEITEDSKPLECPIGYILNEELGVCISSN